MYIVALLEEVGDDILENLVQFIKEPKALVPFPWMKELPFRKYEVNVIVYNADLEGAPVIIELNPPIKTSTMAQSPERLLEQRLS